MKLKSWQQILLALALAILFGAIVNKTQLISFDPKLEMKPFGNFYVGVTGYLGDLFMQLLKMIIVPLIFSSVVVGIAGVGNADGFGRRGLKTLAYYVLTSFLAIITGLALVNTVKPGLVNGEPNENIIKAIEANETAYADNVSAKVGTQDTESLSSVWDIFKRMIPENVFHVFTDNGQMLALIFVSLLTGLAILYLEEHNGLHMLRFFEAVNELMLKITSWVMILMPIGVFCLVTKTISVSGFGTFMVLGKYFLVVVAALLFHMFVNMSLVLAVLGKVNPIRHFQAMRNAILTAFSTSSSSATLAVTMRAVRENAGVSNKVSSFTLPLGATVNMDGTALYECIAVLFIAQVLGADLGFTAQFAVVVLSLLTSIGVAGVPSASLIAIVIIVENVLVGEGMITMEAAAGVIGLLLAVDRLLDMTRTAVNVFSDSCGAVVIAKSEGETGILEDPMHTAEEHG